MRERQVDVAEIPLSEYCWQEVWGLIALFVVYLGICMLIFRGLAHFVE
ncbi:hypothetical protein ACFL2V_20540 [Pseudomonadota bacterium]